MTIRGMERKREGILREWTLYPETDPGVELRWFESTQIIAVENLGTQELIQIDPEDSKAGIDRIEARCWEWLHRNR